MRSPTTAPSNVRTTPLPLATATTLAPTPDTLPATTTVSAPLKTLPGPSECASVCDLMMMMKGVKAPGLLWSQETNALSSILGGEGAAYSLNDTWHHRRRPCLDLFYCSQHKETCCSFRTTQLTEILSSFRSLWQVQSRCWVLGGWVLKYWPEQFQQSEGFPLPNRFLFP